MHDLLGGDFGLAMDLTLKHKLLALGLPLPLLFLMMFLGFGVRRRFGSTKEKERKTTNEVGKLKKLVVVFKEEHLACAFERKGEISLLHTVGNLRSFVARHTDKRKKTLWSDWRAN